MLREFAALAIATLIPACSFILDFSDVPRDGGADATFTQADCDYKEPNDSFSTAAIISLTDTGPAAICPPAVMGGAEDHDFYRFTVANTTSMMIEIRYEMSTSGDLDLTLYDSSGNMVTSSHLSTGMEKITCPSSVSPPCPPVVAGDYVFEVEPAVSGSVNRYTFSLAN
jgi:hypothetical protein